MSARAGPRQSARASWALPRGDERFEPLEVQLARLDAHEVARRARDDPIGAECLPERVDVDLDRAGAARGRRFAPDPVDQPVGRDGHVGVEQQHGEHGARPLAAELDARAVVAQNLERTKQPELHDPGDPFLSRAWADPKRTPRGCNST